MRFGILRKFLLAFLVISLVPLVALSFHAHQKIVEVGQKAVDSSRQVLIENAMSLLEARARSISRQVELFLEECADDLISLSVLPVDPEIYLNFSKSHKRQIWMRAGSVDEPKDIRFKIPLYKEITFVDPNGVEQIHIRANQVTAGGQDLSRPHASTYGWEDYFNQARSLHRGQYYVSHLLGRHVRKSEQLQGAPDVERAYGGKIYDGIIRFAMPVFRDDRTIGVVSIALDHRHLMEFTQHVLPIGSHEVVFPSYSSGNYAFLFDDEGWIITHPKFWDIRGHDPDTGFLVDPNSSLYNEEALKEGFIPFNLLHVPFVHVNYRHVALEVIAGRSGVTQTSSVAGVSRVLAFAPIQFPFGEYRQTGYFGGVTLGAQTDIFHEAINQTSAEIHQALNATTRHFILIIIVAACIVAFIASLLARSFTRPILLLSQKAKEISRGQFRFPVAIHSGDELEELGQKFEEMGQQLDKQQKSLIHSLNALAASKNDTEKYSRRLEKQVDILRNLHSVGNYLTIHAEQQQAVDITLKTCVEGIGFARALLYLFDSRKQQLNCTQTYGFDPEIEKIARQVHYNVQKDDCVVTRVFNSGAAEKIEEALTNKTTCELDRRLAAQNASLALVFAPIRAGERIIGVLGADHGTGSATIAAEEMESLKIIANEAAMAIERARLMEEAVRERDFKENIFANMMSGLIVVDSKKVVRTINPRAEKFLALPAAALIGHSIEQALNAYPPLLKVIQQVKTDQVFTSSDLEIQMDDGQRRYLEVAISPLKGVRRSDDNSILVIFRDTTNRIALEKRMRRSERLVSLGTLAAGIAHEIRNPLTGISLLLDDLHDQMQSSTEERTIIQKALNEIEKLEKIITELLDFASNPTSRMVVKDLDKVIEQTLFLIQKQADQQNVVIRRSSHHALPPVRLDAEKIKQALLNIFINALHLMPNGGEIHIDTQLVEDMDLLPVNRAIKLTIRDTGPGIDPGDIEYIFDPFFSRNPNGSGLGLSITHTIIEEHMGKIIAEGQPGQGAVFSIWLPITENGNSRT